MRTLGLYLHVPFCKSKCRYCDFCSFPHPKQETVAAYLDALCGEITSYGQKENPFFSDVSESEVDTVYFGGGTPSLLSPKDFSRIMETLQGTFCLSSTPEITVECNPATVDRTYLAALHSLGVNRLSIGAQSMQNNELRLLGRLHTADDVRKAVADARAAGFDNISIDLMLGIPEQTEESLAETLNDLLALSPDHLSAYGLQIEEGTYFAKHQDELPLPSEDTVCDMYTRTADLLANAGLFRYEISNFAKKGYESRHNLRYWHRDDYLGLGVAAHSSIGNRRFFNTDSLEHYLNGARREAEDIISPHGILCEKIMLGMRLADGVDFSALICHHGEEARIYRDILADYVEPGFVKLDGERLSFTSEGMYVSNTILAHVLDFQE